MSSKNSRFSKNAVSELLVPVLLVASGIALAGILIGNIDVLTKGEVAKTKEKHDVIASCYGLAWILWKVYKVNDQLFIVIENQGKYPLWGFEIEFPNAKQVLVFNTSLLPGEKGFFQVQENATEFTLTPIVPKKGLKFPEDYIVCSGIKRLYSSSILAPIVTVSNSVDQVMNLLGNVKNLFSSSQGNAIGQYFVFGNSSYDMHPQAMIKDGNYIYICGVLSNGPIGNSDAFIMKIDLNGNVIWAKAFGTSNKDGCISIIKGSTILISGYDNNHGYLTGEGFVCKVSSDGNLDCYKVSGTLGIYELYLSDALYLPCKTGYGTYSSQCMIKANPDLSSVIWARYYDKSGDGYCGRVVLEDSSGIYVRCGGDEYSAFNYGEYVYKINKSNGNIIWQRFLFLPSKKSVGSTNACSLDENYFIMGFRRREGTSDKGTLIKINKNTGDFVYKRETDLSEFTPTYLVCPDILVGHYLGTNKDSFIATFSDLGTDLKINKALGFIGEGDDYIYRAIKDSQLILLGATKSFSSEKRIILYFYPEQSQDWKETNNTIDTKFLSINTHDNSYSWFNPGINTHSMSSSFSSTAFSIKDLSLEAIKGYFIP